MGFEDKAKNQPIANQTNQIFCWNQSKDAKSVWIKDIGSNNEAGES